MKTFLKILFWSGIGFGFGFFVGYQAGVRSERTADEDADEVMDALYEKAWEAGFKAAEEVDETLNSYRGEAAEDQEEEEPSPEKAPDHPVILEPQEYDIPQLHPQDMAFTLITEKEAVDILNDPGNTMDEVRMIWYTQDEVLYNVTDRTVVTEPDSEVGVGTTMAFGGDPRHPVSTLWVKSETWGRVIRIDAVDDCFADSVDGTVHPDDDDEEEPF